MPLKETAVQTKPTTPTGDEIAKQPHETEQERKLALLARVRSTRSSLLAQLAQVEGKNDSKDYIWANNSEARLTTFKTQGYEICCDPKVKSQWVREDGSHVRGDLILMEISKELREAWKFNSEDLAVSSLENAQTGFKEFAERNGVPVQNPRI
jgi:hypothetical protein